MADKLTELISSIMSELKQIAATETVVGEPVKLGERMAIPVTKLTVGFGVGGGQGQSNASGEGFAGGGGGGARVEPIGFIVFDKEKVSFLPTKPGKYDGLIDAIPGVIDKVKEFASSKGKNKDNKNVDDKNEGKEG